MRTALVTGAAGGIGGALCERLADPAAPGGGYRVLAHARSKAKAESVGDFEPVWGDITRDDEIAAVARQVVSFGGADLVVHNAGVLTDTKTLGPHGLGMQAEVNVLAPLLLTRALKDAGALKDGALVLVNSSSAANFARSHDYDTLATPDGSSLFGQYAVSKAAANALVVHMAKVFPDHRFVAVEPGFVKTDMTAANPSMPWFMGKLAPIFGSSPEKAAKRVLDTALEGDHPSGTILQGTKVATDGKWSSDAAQASLAKLLQRA